MSSTAPDAARKAGVEEEFVSRYRQLELVDTDAAGTFTDKAVRRIQVLRTLEQAGIPIDGLAHMVRSGDVSLDFIDTALQGVFVPLSDRSFEEVSEETGIPVETLASIRESVGGAPPSPDDLMGEEELVILEWVEEQHSLGFRTRTIEQVLRVYGESFRRAAETEAEFFRSEIVQPMFARGLTEDDVGRFIAEIGPRLSQLSDRATQAIYHRQQRHAWSVNFIDGIGSALAKAGLYQRDTGIPAMCFLDITGYTQLTQEHGDQAAADLAEEVRRIVERVAVRLGGRAVKWLGDGVMFHFPVPGSAVEAALEMVASVESAASVAAHVGIHAGPVIFREGDYYGNTVNVAARIGEFARPGEVLVSQDVVDLSTSPTTFEKIGLVELKGIGDALVLHAAQAEEHHAPA